MTYQSRLLGALGVLAQKDEPRPRSDNLLSALAAQAAIALDNAILYRRAERESLQNQILLESSQLLLSSLDLDEILDAIMDSLQRAVPYNAAGIFLVDGKGQVERIVDRGYNPDNRPALDLKAGVGLVGWVASSGQPLVVDDVQSDPRYQNARKSTRSEMVVPIFAGSGSWVFSISNVTWSPDSMKSISTWCTRLPSMQAWPSNVPECMPH